MREGVGDGCVGLYKQASVCSGLDEKISRLYSMKGDLTRTKFC